MGLKEGADPRRLEEAGWAAVFAENADPAIREALEPLLRLRRGQAGRRRAERRLPGADEATRRCDRRAMGDDR